MDTKITVTKPLPPEDIRPGEYIALLSETHELLNIFAMCDPLLGRELKVRIEFLAEDAGAPLMVVAVCLPFVLVEDANQKHRTLDVRRQAVARLDEDYARRAMKRLKRAVTKA